MTSGIYIRYSPLNALQSAIHYGHVATCRRRGVSNWTSSGMCGWFGGPHTATISARAPGGSCASNPIGDAPNNRQVGGADILDLQWTAFGPAQLD
jgi:hypothetical protein